MPMNWNCDGTGPHAEDRQVRLLPIAGASNAILCKECYRKEMAWRRRRISKGVAYDLPAWEDLKPYPEQ